MIRGCLFLFALILVAAAAFCGSAWVTYVNRERVLAMEWGDGRYGDRFYGAKLTLEPEDHGFAVRGIVLISADALGDVSYRHECGVIGHVKDFDEATKRFGVIDWKPDGLHVGKYFLPRAEFENHR